MSFHHSSHSLFIFIYVLCSRFPRFSFTVTKCFIVVANTKKLSILKLKRSIHCRHRHTRQSIGDFFSADCTNLYMCRFMSWIFPPLWNVTLFLMGSLFSLSFSFQFINFISSLTSRSSLEADIRIRLISSSSQLLFFFALLFCSVRARNVFMFYWRLSLLFPGNIAYSASENIVD